MAAVPITKAAKIAAGEVFMPVFSGTMTTLAPFIPLAFWHSLIGSFMFFLPITLIITLLASLVVAYIMNPVFAVDFMKPHYEGEHDHQTFDRKTTRTTLILAGVTAFFYLLAAIGVISIGIGNFMVLLIMLFLFNHFVLLKVIDQVPEECYGRAFNHGMRAGLNVRCIIRGG